MSIAENYGAMQAEQKRKNDDAVNLLQFFLSRSWREAAFGLSFLETKGESQMWQQI